MTKGIYSSDLPDHLQLLDFNTLILGFTDSGKVLLIDKSASGRHLTVQPGHASGILDVHLTEPKAGAPSRTLFAIRRDDLAQVCEQILPTFEADLLALVRRIVRRVRPGWLWHHGIYVLPFGYLGPDDLSELGTITGRRWKMNPERFTQRFARPLRRSELDAAPDGPFLLFNRRRNDGAAYGVLIKTTENERVYYFWFKSSRLMAEMQKFWRHLAPHLKPFVLDPEVARQELEARGYVARQVAP